MKNKLLSVSVVIALLLTCTLAATATNVVVGPPQILMFSLPWWCQILCVPSCKAMTTNGVDYEDCLDNCACVVCGI